MKTSLSEINSEAAVRVLVVDDNPQDRRLVIRELRKAFPHAEILEAISPSQLQSHLSVVDFDVVVTDYHLQWSDGITVLKEVKRLKPHCPVIMFTATGSEEIAVEAMKHGLDDYVIKNVRHLVRLRAAVQASLEHAGTRIRAQQLESRLDSLLSQLQVGIFSCSSDGAFIECNREMIRLIDAFQDDHPLKTLNDLFPDNLSAVAFRQRLTKSASPCEIELEFNGGDRPTFLRLTAKWVGPAGSPPRIEGLLEDITIRKRAEQEERRAAVAAAMVGGLSPREKQVLDAVSAGYANKVIARRLEISEKTVEKHRASVMKKLAVRSVAELVTLKLQAERVFE